MCASRDYVFTAHVSVCVPAYAGLTSSSPCSAERWTDGHSGGIGGLTQVRRRGTKGRRKDFPISSPSFCSHTRHQAVPQTCQTNRWCKGVFEGTFGWQWDDAGSNLENKGDIVLAKWCWNGIQVALMWFARCITTRRKQRGMHKEIMAIKLLCLWVMKNKSTLLGKWYFCDSVPRSLAL